MSTNPGDGKILALDKHDKISTCSTCYAKKAKPNRCMNLLRQIKESRFIKCAFYRNNSEYFLFILIYFAIQIIISIIQLWLYWNSNVAIRVARVAGILISFNFAFSLFLVLRKLLTWLRSTKFGQMCLPLDDFIDFHKYIGVFLLVLSLVHTIAHCVNLYWLSNEYNRKSFGARLSNATNYPSYASLLFTTSSHLGWFYNSAMPTGWILLVFICVMEFFSIPCIRQKGHFQLFYYTHWLYYPIFILCILHAKNFWRWFIIPALFVFVERVYRFFRVKSSDYGVTYIKDVNLLPSRVTQLVIPRPANFKFKSGDYLFINIPIIANNEWHPFTISSAPELKEEIWLHIRSLGNWTNKLHDYFWEYSKFSRQNTIYKTKRRFSHIFKRFTKQKEEEEDQPNIVTLNYSEIDAPDDLFSSIEETSLSASEHVNKQKLQSMKSVNSTKIKLNLLISNRIRGVWCDVHIDGPYGTASRRIFHAEHAVLIAGGIGVTPFASILQSLWFKYSKSLKTCPSCEHQWYDLPMSEEKKLKKVDFIWVNRDHKAFEWFIDLLAQLEMQQSKSNQKDRFIDMKLFVTSATSKDEIKSNAIAAYSDLNGNVTSDITLKLIVERKLKELIQKIEPGRPNFDQIFKDISSQKKGKIEVFFCGANEFGEVVQRKCENFGFKFSREYF